MAAAGRRVAPPRAAAVAGMIFSALMATTLIIARLAIPDFRTDTGEWMSDPVRRSAVRFAIHLVPFTGVAFLWFIGVLRNLLGEMEDQFFATVFLGSGLLFVASLFASGGLSGALLEAMTAQPRVINQESYYLARRLAGAFLNVFAIKMAGVFTISSSTILLRTRILPRWISWSGFACAAVLMLIMTNWPWIALLFPLWIFVVSVRILVHKRSAGQATGGELSPNHA